MLNGSEPVSALERWMDAVEARTEAERAGDASALEDATREVEQARMWLGAQFVTGFRAALEQFTPGLDELLERLLGAGMVARLESRAEWCEREVVKLQREVDRLKCENWQLAKELAKQRQRREMV